jgi:ABC-2 type transport system ATP-binding protein/lipopolysaccharide transport system ATP-binding protein
VTPAVISLESVSVRFRVPQERIVSFKEFAIQRIRRRLKYVELLALREVSLQVMPGETVGIIGRNGAGKSTLLRLVARVMLPTHGRVRVVGNVAPLLELGAGFHPELTGRENVYLNATLLGHRRPEVEQRFDEIVEFAELAEFIDAPLRTYSSGMGARLGFAVATAWRPDILLVDETLSVGDEAFRRKCDTRIQSYRARGMTMLLASHDLTFVREACQRAIWLDHGGVRLAGGAGDVSEAYHLAA